MTLVKIIVKALVLMIVAQVIIKIPPQKFVLNVMEYLLVLLAQVLIKISANHAKDQHSYMINNV